MREYPVNTLKTEKRSRPCRGGGRWAAVHYMDGKQIWCAAGFLTKKDALDRLQEYADGIRSLIEPLMHIETEQ